MYKAVYKELHYKDLMALCDVMQRKCEEHINATKKPDSLTINNMLDDVIEILYEKKLYINY